MWLVTTFLMIQDKVLKHRSLWLCITLGTEAGAERSIHAGPAHHLPLTDGAIPASLSRVITPLSQHLRHVHLAVPSLPLKYC